MFNKEYLKAILAVQSFSHKDETMQLFLYKELGSIEGVNIQNDEYGNIYCTKGGGIGAEKLYPCVVSHIDTVHALIPDKNFHVVEAGGTVFGWDSAKNGLHGIGGDDKVGIYMCLQLLKDLDNLKIVLFRNEEVGCLGSKEAYMPFFDDVTFVLQADRRGSSDFISYSNGTDLMGDEFLDGAKAILTKHKYSKASGTSTDVGQLKKNGLAVCCANVSCGYYSAHSHSEYVVLSETEVCFNLFRDLIQGIGHRKWLHEYVPYVYTPPAFTGYGRGYFQVGGNAHAVTAPSGESKKGKKQKKKTHRYYQPIK